MFNDRFFRNFDFVLFFAVMALNIISLVMITSATSDIALIDNAYSYAQRQGVFLLINLFLMIFFLKFDYEQLERFSLLFYFVSIIMLLAVMFVGHSALGAQRWIQIGPVSIQPSEFSKLIMIIVLAKVLNDRKEDFTSIWEALPVFAYLFLPFLLVLKQPDLGTSLVFIAIALSMLYIAGIPSKLYGMLAGGAVMLAPAIWHLLKDYQKMRIMVFLDPEKDPYGAGYHIIQSKIAIGSGLLMGKGLFSGTQSQLNFLPENHTDFIFAVIGEELGFLGTMAVLFLYGIIIYRGIRIAMEAKNDFGALLATGIVAMLTFHILVNIGMTIGIMPVTGIPLPFMSYGVSALTTNMMCVSILLNINMRRKKLSF